MLSTREKLAQVEDQIRGLREDKARATRLRDAAVQAASQNDDDASLEAARAAKDSVAELQSRLDGLQEEQTGLLRNLGDAENGRVGLDLPTDSGYAKAAAGLDLANGALRVDVTAMSLLRAPAVLPRSPQDGSFSLATAEQSRRYLYPVMARESFGDGSEMAATDFVVTFPFAGDGLTGVERTPDATTEKAVLEAETSLAIVEARQHAIVLEGVPSKLFDNVAALRAYLGVEMARRVDESVDAHLVSKIEAANPPSGSTGATLIAKIRNGIAEMRDLGGVPSYLAVTPEEAAGLDLSVQPGSGDYIFNVQLEGAGGIVWSLIVREVPTISDPTLIDPQTLGVLYTGQGSVLVDPYSGMTTNQVRVRVELEATAHIRNVAQGAYVIA